MMTRVALTISLALGLLVAACATEPEPLTLTAATPPAISLDKPTHFTGPDGSDLVVEPDTYVVEESDGALKLNPSSGTRSLVIQSQPITHDETLTAPVALSTPAGEDEHHILLMTPNGKGLEAIGSYTGVRARAGSMLPGGSFKPGGIPEPGGIPGPGTIPIPGGNPVPIKPDLRHDLLAIQQNKGGIEIHCVAKLGMPAPGGRLELVPRIDYWMPDRFGLDRNRNGMIDLPNTAGYVHNSPRILDIPPTVEFWDIQPTIRDSFTAVLKADVTRRILFEAEPTGCPSGPGKPVVLSYRWTIHAVQGTYISVPQVRTTSNTQVAVNLPEGTYTITLTAMAADWKTEASVTGPVKVEDLFIVAIGDSKASGEGNPEKVNYRYQINCHFEDGSGAPFYIKRIYWGDDGQSSPDPEPLKLPCSSEQPFPAEYAYMNWLRQLPPMSPVALAHVKAHRSSVSFPAQAALALERADPRTSVTFVSLAASGSGIGKGLTKEYKGIVEVTPGSILPPQLTELGQLTSGRKIDALVISIGINDAGFSKVAAALIIHAHFGVTTSAIRQAIHDGKWKALEYLETRWANALEYIFENINWYNVDGLDRLSPSHPEFTFRLLNEAIRKNLNVGKVFLTGYPDAFTVWDGSTLVTCPEAMTNAAPNTGFRLDRNEMNFAREEFQRPLNENLEQTARTMGWVYVPPADFAGHGICAPLPNGYGYNGYGLNPVPIQTGGYRWIRNIKESSDIQGPNKEETTGTLHPNEFGHRATSEGLLSALRAQGIGR